MNEQTSELVLRLPGENGKTIRIEDEKCLLRSVQANKMTDCCAIYNGSHGTALRSYSDHVLVNGEAASARWLNAGDRIELPGSMLVEVEAATQLRPISREKVQDAAQVSEQLSRILAPAKPHIAGSEPTGEAAVQAQSPVQAQSQKNIETVAVAAPAAEPQQPQLATELPREDSNDRAAALQSLFSNLGIGSENTTPKGTTQTATTQTATSEVIMPEPVSTPALQTLPPPTISETRFEAELPTVAPSQEAPSQEAPTETFSSAETEQQPLVVEYTMDTPVAPSGNDQVSETFPTMNSLLPDAAPAETSTWQESAPAEPLAAAVIDTVDPTTAKPTTPNADEILEAKRSELASLFGATAATTSPNAAAPPVAAISAPETPLSPVDAGSLAALFEAAPTPVREPLLESVPEVQSEPIVPPTPDQFAEIPEEPMATATQESTQEPNPAPASELPSSLRDQLNDLMSSLSQESSEPAAPTAEPVVEPVADVDVNVLGQPTFASTPESPESPESPEELDSTDDAAEESIFDTTAEPAQTSSPGVAEILGKMGFSIPTNDEDTPQQSADPMPTLESETSTLSPTAAATTMAVPVMAPAPAPTTTSPPAPIATTKEPVDDIEAYMNKLLNRPNEAATAAAEKAAVEEQLEAEEARTNVPSVLSEEEFVPRQKAKRLEDFDTLREIANTCSRTAIRDSNAKSEQDSFKTKVALFGAALAGSLGAYFFDSKLALIGFLAAAVCTSYLFYKAHLQHNLAERKQEKANAQ